MSEKVSVIIPVYNAECFIRQCIDSIIQQSYRELEIILVDDGSTDASGKICDEYAARDMRVKVIHKENGGAPSARNAALDVATGEYIEFVDSDDYLEYDLCKVCTQLMSDNMLDVLIFDKYIHEKDKVQHISEWNHTFLTEDTELIKMIDLAMVYRKFSPYEYKSSPLYIWNKMYRRSIIEKHHIRFEDRVYGQDDICFNTVYFGYAERIQYINTPLYHYCFINDSLSHKYVKNRVEWDNALTYALMEIPNKYDGIRLPALFTQAIYCRVIFNYYLCGARCFFHAENRSNLIEKIKHADSVTRSEPYATAFKNVDMKYLEKHHRILTQSKHSGMMLWIITAIHSVKRKLANAIVVKK